MISSGAPATLLILLLSLLAASCSTLPRGYEEPVVNVVSIRGSSGARFDIVLRVVNPNDFDINLEGVAWSLDVEGRRILTAVSNQLPVIAAYSESEVALSATPGIFNAVRVLLDLTRGGNQDLNYLLNLRLDAGGLLPDINIRDEGRINLAEAVTGLQIQ